MESDDPRDPLAEKYAIMGVAEKLEWMIETAGWALEPVAANAEHDPPTPAYAYSIGLPTAVAYPDVAIFGLSPVASNGLVTLVADACRGGTEIPLGVELLGLLDNNLRCLFAPIRLDIWGPYFPAANDWYQGEPFEMVQLLYPDRNGFMPYEARYKQRLRFAQPIIGTVPPTP